MKSGIAQAKVSLGNAKDKIKTNMPVPFRNKQVIEDHTNSKYSLDGPDFD